MRFYTLAEIELLKRQPRQQEPLTATTVTEGPGVLRLESRYHGAILDQLEELGFLSVRPGVEDVANPDGWGESLLEGDRRGLLRKLDLLGWDVVPSCSDRAYWDGMHCEPLMMGGRLVLRPAP